MLTVSEKLYCVSLKTEALRSFETLVTIKKSTRRTIPEDMESSNETVFKRNRSIALCGDLNVEETVDLS